MPTFHPRFLLLLLAFIGLTFGSCKKSDETQPPKTATQQLTTGSWRLDQVKQNGQTTGSGANIKDQYSLTFRPDGTYSQKLLSDNTTYQGKAWMLMSNDTVLHLTDQKGTEASYTVLSLTATELRYSFTNKDNQLEERIFSAQS